MPTTTTRLTVTPPHADRATFVLTPEEEQIAISFAVGLRTVVRRAVAAGHSAADVAEAFERALSDWPPDRREAVLRAVDALVRLPTLRPAMLPAAPLTGDAINFGGNAA
jgi:hypothetical protein